MVPPPNIIVMRCANTIAVLENNRVHHQHSTPFVQLFLSAAFGSTKMTGPWARPVTPFAQHSYSVKSCYRVPRSERNPSSDLPAAHAESSIDLQRLPFLFPNHRNRPLTVSPKWHRPPFFGKVAQPVTIRIIFFLRSST